MIETLLTARQGRELLGLPVSTFGWWVRHGAVRPIIAGSGKGSAMIYNVKQVWAIGIAKSLRASGATLEVACRVAGFLEGLTAKQIETAFANGETCIMVYHTDDGVEFLPLLVRPEAATKNPTLRKVRQEAASKGHVFQWTGLDAKPMLDQIIRKVEETTSKQTARRGATRRRS